MSYPAVTVTTSYSDILAIGVIGGQEWPMVWWRTYWAIRLNMLGQADPMDVWPRHAWGRLL